MQKKRKVTKAVIAAAGMGTRFLPATKNQPKEMLPIIDKPIIHYLAQELVDSGIEDIIIVTRAGNHILEDYFDNRSELEYSLEKSGKKERLKAIQDVTKMANFIYVRQKNHLPYGNATPLLAAQKLIDDDEAFVYMFGDDLTISAVPVTKQLIDVYEKHHPSAILAVQEVPDEEVERYGTVKYKKNAEYPYEIEEGLEKMPLGKNPSNMAQFGRFVFTYDVVKEAAKGKTGMNDELWVLDILNSLAKQGHKVFAQPIDGEWLTTGDPMRYLKTTLKYVMLNEEMKDDLLDFVQRELISKK